MLSGMTNLVLVTSLISLLTVAVWRYGADSRDGRDWQRAADPAVAGRAPYRRAHTPAADLVSVGRSIRRLVAAIVEFHRAQTDLWERYHAAQRPWETERLHWARTRRGWVLRGRCAPTAPAGRTPTR